MTRRTFVLLVCRVVAVLSAIAFADLVWHVANWIGLVLHTQHEADWRFEFPFGVVSAAVMLTIGGWLCWPLAARIASWVAQGGEPLEGRVTVASGALIVGSSVAGQRMLIDATSRGFDRWRSYQFFGSVKAWELEFSPNLDQPYALSAILGAATCIVTAALVLRRIALGGYQMHERTSFVISRRDLGFVVARGLAVLCWIYGISAFVVVFTETIRNVGASNAGLHLAFSYDFVGHGIVFLLAMVGASAWLWSHADTFAKDSASSDTEPVVLSRRALFQGVLAAIGVFYAARSVPSLAFWLYDVLVPKAGPPSIVRSQVVEAVVNAVIAFAILIWAYRLQLQLGDLDPQTT